MSHDVSLEIFHPGRSRKETIGIEIFSIFLSLNSLKMLEPFFFRAQEKYGPPTTRVNLLGNQSLIGGRHQSLGAVLSCTSWKPSHL